MRRPLFAIACLALLALVPFVAPASDAARTGTDNTITVGPDGDRLWPFTSRSRAFEGRTLVLNVIVTEDPKTVERMLSRRAATDWTARQPDSGVQPPAPGVGRVDDDWRGAHGAIRYTYAEADGDGQWLKQRYQLHVGTYLGTRHHIRAFAPSRDSEWTALQAHSEYWDWFRLRHTVTEVHATADRLEADFRRLDGATVERAYTRQRGPLRDGIVVVSGLVPILVGRGGLRSLRGRLAGALSDPDRRTRTLGLAAIAAGAPLAIRVAGIALERLVPLVTPKLFVVMLYPWLAIALPVAVARQSSELPPWLAAPVATLGLSAGFAAEFAVLGVTPPPGLVWHRLFVAAALGVVAAAAAASGGRRSLGTLAGASLWLAGLLVPLFGLL